MMTGGTPMTQETSFFASQNQRLLRLDRHVSYFIPPSVLKFKTADEPGEAQLKEQLSGSCDDEKLIPSYFGG